MWIPHSARRVPFAVAARHGGGAFSEPSALGKTVYTPEIEIDAAGNVLVVWQEDVNEDGTVYSIKASRLYRGADQFSPPEVVRENLPSPPNPSLALAHGNTFVLAWGEGSSIWSNEPVSVVAAASATADGSFGPTTELGIGRGLGFSCCSSSYPRVVANERGDAIVYWTDDWALEASVRRPGESFGPAQTLYAAGEDLDSRPLGFDVGLDRDGAAIATWSAVSWARSSFLLPTGAVFGPERGLPVGGPVTAAFDALGNLVLAYYQDGRVRLLMADRDGSYAEPITPSETADIVDLPALAFEPSGNAAIALWRTYTPDTRGARLVYSAYDLNEFERAATPRVEAFAYSPSRASGPALTSRRRTARPLFRYRLSKAGAARITIERRAKRRGRTCRRIRRGRYLCPVGVVRHTARAGSNRARLRPRLSRRMARHGRLRATITATDPAGRTSKRRTIRLRARRS